MRSRIELAPPSDRSDRVIVRAALKRGVDVVGAIGGLVIFGPLMAAIAVIVKLESPGPALFRQVRVGEDGKPFTCMKFRSMRTEADPEVHRSAFARMVSGMPMSADPDAPFKLDEDPRVTRVGQFIRATSLDELPQLFNVLAGDMSLVGPRPAIPYEIEHYEEWHHDRYSVKPGITGIWQVFGRGRVGFQEQMRMDVDYARTWTVREDIRLIAKTIPVVIRRSGAR